MRRKGNPWLAVLFWTLLSFLTLFPIYWLFVISVKPAVELFSTPSLWLTDLYWKNYADVLNNSTLRGYMLNSLIISVTSTVVAVVIGMSGAHDAGLAQFSAEASPLPLLMLIPVAIMLIVANSAFTIIRSGPFLPDQLAPPG